MIAIAQQKDHLFKKNISVSNLYPILNGIGIFNHKKVVLFLN